MMFAKLWSWLKSPDNRDIVKMAAGGLAALVVGAWGIYTFKAAHSSGQRVSATSGGVAAGRDASNNVVSMTSAAPAPTESRRASSEAFVRAEGCSIAAGNDATGNSLSCNYGLSPTQLQELTRAAASGATEPLLNRVETLSKSLGVSQSATKTLLKLVGEQQSVSAEDIPAALDRVAAKYKNLQAQVSSLSTDDPIARALVTQVQDEINAGRFQNAGALLGKRTKTVATLNGRCIKAEAMGVAVDQGLCLPEIMNIEFRDHRNAFTFVTRQKGQAAIISFSGDGREQTHPSDDDAIQPIDRVVFTFNGSSDYLKANGNCSFANPYKNAPASVSCAVGTSEGRFAGEFISDGVSPNVFEADAITDSSQSKALPNFSQPQILVGHCEDSSHVAEGVVGEDLSGKRSRFFCDQAVVITFADDPNHRLVQFVESHSDHARQLGFGGEMRDREIMQVRSAYLEAGRSSTVSEGECKFFFDKQDITGIACGMKIDEKRRRTVTVVAFTAESHRR